MPTRVHIPEVLLRAVDRRARVLGISRDELIVKALERELQDDPGWSEGFFERLASPEAAVAEAAEEMLDGIRPGAVRGGRPPDPQSWLRS